MDTPEVGNERKEIMAAILARAALDEADGALDPEARMLYLRMLETAHRESGRFQTILITHSTELQAMVARTIDVAALEARTSEIKELVA